MPAPGWFNSSPFARYLELRGLVDKRRRYAIVDNFEKRPLIAADMDPSSISQTTVRLLAQANPRFFAAGSNMTSALAAFAAGGGVNIQTAGGANTTDSALIGPGFVNTTVAISDLQAATWPTAKSVHLDWLVDFGAVTALKFAAGLKLTSTPVLITDDDQAMFYFDTTYATDPTLWHLVTSNGADTTVDQVLTADTGRVAAPAISTLYHLRIEIDADKVPTYYIGAAGGELQLAGTAKALRTLTTLFPFISAIQVTNSVAANFNIRGFAISRLY